MSNICDKCGRGILSGHNVSHAKNRTVKYSKPNLHEVSFAKGMASRRLCSSCLRQLRRVKAQALRSHS